MGPNRELKFALEKFWKGSIDEPALLKVANSVEEQAWKLQVKAGIQRISVGDHYLYDAILSWADWLGLIPARFQAAPRGLNRMFGMARGMEGAVALSKSMHVFARLGTRLFFALTDCPNVIRYEKVDHKQLSLPCARD